jgi:hypothetical protein
MRWRAGTAKDDILKAVVVFISSLNHGYACNQLVVYARVSAAFLKPFVI